MCKFIFLESKEMDCYLLKKFWSHKVSFADLPANCVPVPRQNKPLSPKMKCFGATVMYNLVAKLENRMI